MLRITIKVFTRCDVSIEVLFRRTSIVKRASGQPRAVVLSASGYNCSLKLIYTYNNSRRFYLLDTLRVVFSRNIDKALTTLSNML